MISKVNSGSFEELFQGFNVNGAGALNIDYSEEFLLGDCLVFEQFAGYLFHLEVGFGVEGVDFVDLVFGELSDVGVDSVKL